MKTDPFFISSDLVFQGKLEKIAEKINEIAKAGNIVILRAIRGFQSPHEAINCWESWKNKESPINLKECFLSQIDTQPIPVNCEPVFVEDNEIVLCAGKDQRRVMVGDVVSITSRPIDGRWHVIIRPLQSKSFYFWTFVKK